MMLYCQRCGNYSRIIKRYAVVAHGIRDCRSVTICTTPRCGNHGHAKPVKPRSASPLFERAQLYLGL